MLKMLASPRKCYLQNYSIAAMIHTFIHLLHFDVEAFKKNKAVLIPEQPSPFKVNRISLVNIICQRTRRTYGL